MSVLKVKKLFHDTIVPERKTEWSAGYDVSSYEDCIIEPLSSKLIGTGICVNVPSGTYGQLAPRSGLSCKGSTVGAGVIDSDYTGEVKVLLFNLNKESELVINKGDRIAQLIIKCILQSPVEVVESLDDTDRGEGGFGSTGV